MFEESTSSEIAGENTPETTETPEETTNEPVVDNENTDPAFEEAKPEDPAEAEEAEEEKSDEE